jgi:hypothetical protein
VTIGSEIDETLVLQSRTGTPFRVVDVSCTSPDIRIEPIGEVTPTTRSYRVKQAVTAAGRQRSTLRVRVRGHTQGEHPRTIVIPVEYYGYSASDTARLER